MVIREYVFGRARISVVGLKNDGYVVSAHIGNENFVGLYRNRARALAVADEILAGTSVAMEDMDDSK